MKNVILCGGSGTRLWPLSRSGYPKQFVPLFDKESLYKATIRRNSSLCDESIVVTNKAHMFIAANQFYEVQERKGSLTLVLEPIGRNTAPAIALACLNAGEGETVIVTPSDHLIFDQTGYTEKVEEAKLLAERGKLVTFGIPPLCPETGYGYIEIEEENGRISTNGFDVLSFREKPDKETAEYFLGEMRYLWNSGIFVFKAGVFLEELKRHNATLYDAALDAYEGSIKKRDEGLGCDVISIAEEKMAAIPSISIDYAVMEKSRNVACVRASIGWNDLGSFDALYEIYEKDEEGNTVHENFIHKGSRNNLVIGNGRTIALVDIEDCLVIDTDDSLLIAKKGSSQHVKAIVDRLKAGRPKERELTEVHATVHRPWGNYTVLDDAEGFKIKRIVVKPGKVLSLQKHMHRSEHWVVVSGTATATVGESVITVRTNESVYIPIACVHRLENQGRIDLVIIETQVGSYLEEDDIIRLDDVYGRV